MASMIGRTSPDNYADFAWKVHYPAICSAIKGSGAQQAAGAGKQGLAIGSGANSIDIVHRGAVAAVLPAQLPYGRKELCVSEISVHMSVLPSIMISKPSMVAPFPAVLDEIKSAVMSELGAYKSAVMKERHSGCDVPIQALLTACRKGLMTIRSKVAKPLEQQRVVWRGATEVALAFGWSHEDGEVHGKSFVLQILASKNPDYAAKYSSTNDLTELGGESSRLKRRRGAADKDMICGFKATFSKPMNEVHERQQFKKFKKLLGRLSEQRIGDMLKTEEDPVQTLKGIYNQLGKHHIQLRAIYRYYCRLGCNTLPGEKPPNHIGNVSALVHNSIRFISVLMSRC